MTNTDWFKKAIIYHLLIDRFAGCQTVLQNRPEFLGGNFHGIVNKLDYLEELGINTLWISPFYKTTAYHGYHVTDYFQVEPRFGSQVDFKKLINACHQRGVRIIADFIPNHCSSQHPFFKEARQDRHSPYRDWFHFRRHPDRYLCYRGYRELPKINLHHPPARQHLLKAAAHWLSLGLDGYRLDYLVGPPENFFLDLKEMVKKKFPAAVLIGEVWGFKLSEIGGVGTRGKHWKWLRGYDHIIHHYRDKIDAALDFKFQNLVVKHIARPNLLRPEFLLKWRLKKHLSRHPAGFYLPTFLDHHDTNRFLFEAGNNKEKLRKAARIQFSIDQPPIIYYGTEIGMTQTKNIKTFNHHGDLQARQTMAWNNPDKELYAFYQNLIQDRKEGKLIPYLE